MLTAPGTWLDAPWGYLQSGCGDPSTTTCGNDFSSVHSLAGEHVWTQEQPSSNFSFGQQSKRGCRLSHGHSSLEDENHVRMATPSPERTYKPPFERMALPHWQTATLVDELVGNRHQSMVNSVVPCPPECTFIRKPRAGRSRQSVKGKQAGTAAGIGGCVPCLPDLDDQCGRGPVEKVVSKGSLGHPSSCALGCKYANKPRGCKDGINCSFCHICLWSRSALKATNAHNFAKHQDAESTNSDSEPVE